MLGSGVGSGRLGSGRLGVGNGRLMLGSGRVGSGRLGNGRPECSSKDGSGCWLAAAGVGLGVGAGVIVMISGGSVTYTIRGDGVGPACGPVSMAASWSSETAIT